MNWGKGILLVFVGFGAIIFTMVGICMKQDDIHLVTKHYYEEEINYQDQIEKASNAALLDQEVLKYDVSSGVLQVYLQEGAKGTLWLFRPSDARMDQKIDFTFENGESKSIDLKELQRGYWRVKIAWSHRGKEFYEEKKINL